VELLLFIVLAFVGMIFDLRGSWSRSSEYSQVHYLRFKDLNRLVYSFSVSGFIFSWIIIIYKSSCRHQRPGTHIGLSHMVFQVIIKMKSGLSLVALGRFFTFRLMHYWKYR